MTMNTIQVEFVNIRCYMSFHALNVVIKHVFSIVGNDFLIKIGVGIQAD